METQISTREQEKRSKLLHDIRTSLSVIKTGSEVALLNINLSIDMQNILKKTIVEVDHSSKILENLL